MRDRLLFLRKFLTHGTDIASVTPSSRWMCRQLARQVTPTRPQHILELGAGTGVVTRVIEDRMHPGSTLVISEQDPDFIARLQSISRRAQVVPGCFQRIADNAHSRTFDLVVSGLPVPSFDDKLRQALFNLLRELAPNAHYAQLTEIPLIYKPIYQRAFSSVRFVPVPLNLPPGGVYHCHGMR